MFQPNKAPGESFTPSRESGTPAVTKLSDAIRVGIPMVEHVPGEWCGCTLATAAVGLGFSGESYQRSKFLRDRYPFLKEPLSGPHPADGYQSGNAYHTVIESLDGGWRGVQWSRERIADWLEAQGY